MTTLDHSAVATHVAATTPYSWPWNGDLDPAGTAALVVAPLGTGTADLGAKLDAVVGVVAAVSAAGGAVIRISTTRPPRSADSNPNSELSIGADATVSAVGIDGFFGSSLDALLRSRGIERLILVGFGLETCIHSTMRSANDRGYECLLVVDACVAYDEALVASSISMIEMSGGIFGAVGTKAAVIEALAAATGENT